MCKGSVSLSSGYRSSLDTLLPRPGAHGTQERQNRRASAVAERVVRQGTGLPNCLGGLHRLSARCCASNVHNQRGRDPIFIRTRIRVVPRRESTDEARAQRLPRLWRRVTVRVANKELMCLVVIVAVSSFLRLYRLDQLPIGLSADTAYKGVAASRILHGDFPIFFAEDWGGVEPMYMYVLAAFMHLLGMTPLVLKATSAVIGIVTVPTLYLLARDLFDSRPIGLLSSFWLAVSYWHLNYSRLGWEIILVPLFVIVTVYFLWRALKSGRPIDFVLAGVCLGASMYTYQAARALAILFVLYLVVWSLMHKRSWRRDGARMGLSLLVATFVFCPLGGYFLTHPDSFTGHANNVSIFNPELNGGSPLGALVSSTAKTVAMFHLLPDPNWRHNPSQRPILDPITGVLFLLGLGITVLRFRRPQYLLILVWILTMSLPAVLTASGLPHSSRSIGLLPVACILPAIGLHEATVWFKSRTASTGVTRLTVLVAVILLLLVTASTYVDYFTVWGNDELALAFDVPFVEAAEVMNALSEPEGVWILPLTSLADPGSVHDTVEFLYRGMAPHHFLSTDEGTVAEELAAVTRGYQEVWVVEWDPAILGGSYLYHADPKGILPFLLGKYASRVSRAEFDAFDVVSYQLPGVPDFAIARSFQPLTVSFGNQIALEGVAYGGSAQGATGTPLGVDTPELSSGADVWVALHWGAKTAPSADYKAAVYLVDSRGRVLAQMDKVLLSSRLETTLQWQPGQIELDYYTLASPPATPPGDYYLEVAVYDAETMARLPVLNQEGTVVGQSKRVGSIQILKPPVAPQVHPQTPVEEGDLAPGLRLLGYDFALREVEPGGTLRVALYWKALEDLEQDYVLSLEVRDQAGGVEVRHVERPVDGTYPTTRWEEGEVLRDWHDVPVPPDAPQGEYELVVTVVEGESVQGQASLGSVTVTGRPHYFTIPDIQHPLQVGVGEHIRLLGYDLENDRVRPGDQLTLTLYWQAVDRVETSYTVFTHLLDAGSQIRAQKDSIPGGGSLPTTSWVEREVIADVYHLTVSSDAPPGDSVLEVGMYDPATGQRLPLRGRSGEPLGDRLLLESTVFVD